MRRVTTILLFSLCILTQAACVSIDLEKLSKGEAEHPGFFDVGAGFAQLQNTDSAANNDARGLMISFKGYPFGRWYSTEKSKSIMVVETRQQAESNEALLSTAKDTLPDVATPPAAGAADDVAAPDAEGTDDDSNNGPNFIALAGEFETLRNSRKGVYCEGPGKTKCRDQMYHRFSVYYGISSSNFVGGDVDSTVHSIGIGFDVSPELSLLLGAGFFDLKSSEEDRSDSDIALMFGVSLNLNAFGSLWSAASGN